jgi:hypothetical protein
MTQANSWTPEEEAIISEIMFSETMHDPDNSDGERRIQCTRMEAIRRMQRRKVDGVYRPPTGLALQAATEETAHRTPNQIAALDARRARPAIGKLFDQPATA